MPPPAPVARGLRGLALGLVWLGVVALALSLVAYVAFVAVAVAGGQAFGRAAAEASRALLLFGVAGAWLFAPSLALAAVARDAGRPRLFRTALAACALTLAMGVGFGLQSIATGKPGLGVELLVQFAAPAAVGTAAGAWLLRPRRVSAATAAAGEA